MVLLRYSNPYDWPLVSGWLRARAIEGVESVDGDEYRRDGVVVRHDAAESALRVEWWARPRAPQKRAEGAHHSAIRRLFDLDADPVAIRAVLAKDRMLAPLLRKRPGIRVPGAWDPFELAVRAIVGQQVSVAAARTLLGRIAASHGFIPERLAETTLGGMPRKRAETIRLLARAVVLEGGLPARLTSIPGIGPWTEQYIAMRLGERDAFPAGDLILRRNAGNLTERELLRRAEAWRPFRAYGAMLLWTTPS
jgi:AraC family transcriptional regulator of adaptative response / DNA-3-methyladenine glycosylase II